MVGKKLTDVKFMTDQLAGASSEYLELRKHELEQGFKSLALFFSVSLTNAEREYLDVMAELYRRDGMAALDA
jgi:DNA phosphorothioation-dependent restriction protein DptG